MEIVALLAKETEVTLGETLESVRVATLCFLRYGHIRTNFGNYME